MKPAIFNTEMVKAIIDGRKTKTRRMMKPQPEKFAWGLSWDNQKKGKKFFGWASTDIDDFKSLVVNHAPYKKGDIIYVRETFVVGIPDGTMPESEENPITVFYKADNSVHGWVNQYEEECNIPWKPSIHMPKEYARLFLRVKDVRIERLNEISEEDAKAEGCWYGKGWGEVDPPLGNDLFPNLWESIYGEGSFNDDYVWVIEFEKISKEEAMKC